LSSIDSAGAKSHLATLYTIGHSTRALEELIAVLQAHKIETLVDIRSFPVSRRLPHFNRESLEQTLPKAEIRYMWMKSLGGFRKRLRQDSPNGALRSAPFRNYADHMLTAEFEQSAAELVRLAEISRAAYMCAERVWFHCHRMLLSDWLVAHGHTVLHIDGSPAPQPHRLTPEAHLVDDQLIYGEQRLFR
jgi:uncharacterized protein (DUF488 family)